MKIAITGATGQLGQLVVKKLKSNEFNHDIIAIIRSSKKGADLGVDVRVANYDDPVALEKAFKGVNILLLISSNEIGKRATQHHNVIEAAKKNGVEWVLYTSILHADTSSIDLAVEHLKTEQDIKESGIPYTILRNGWYTENYTNSISGAIANGAFIGSAGEGRISSASREDYADAAVAIITTSHHQGKIYELAGDNGWTLKDLAEAVSNQTGKVIPYLNKKEDEYIELLVKQGLPKELAKAIAGWDVAASKGDLFDDGRLLSKITGKPTVPLSVTVAHQVKIL